MKRTLRRLVVGVLACSFLVFAPVAAAPDDQIEGVGLWVPTCNGLPSLFTTDMDGSLVGCWYVDALEASSTPSGVYLEYGEETFVGCLWEDGVEVACGTFNTTYKFTAKFDEIGEIRGRCQHPIVKGSGTGGFTGVTGRIDVKDDVVVGASIYRGHVRLD